ncbi:MAG TPA: hypothetical protein VGF76_06140 [Polyangiaceae bacterium]
MKFGARMVTTDGVGNGDDAGSRLMKDVGLAAARFERAMIAARTKAALAVKRARGESTGTPPYGWKTGADGKTLVADEAEQETVGRMRTLREQGWAYRQIRKEGARRGWTSRAGKAFTLQAVFELTKDAECGALVDNSTSPHRHRLRRPDHGERKTTRGVCRQERSNSKTCNVTRTTTYDDDL